MKHLFVIKEEGFDSDNVLIELALRQGIACCTDYGAILPFLLLFAERVAQKKTSLDRVDVFMDLFASNNIQIYQNSLKPFFEVIYQKSLPTPKSVATEFMNRIKQDNSLVAYYVDFLSKFIEVHPNQRDDLFFFDMTEIFGGYQQLETAAKKLNIKTYLITVKPKDKNSFTKNTNFNYYLPSYLEPEREILADLLSYLDQRIENAC